MLTKVMLFKLGDQTRLVEVPADEEEWATFRVLREIARQYLGLVDDEDMERLNLSWEEADGPAQSRLAWADDKDGDGWELTEVPETAAVRA